MSIQTSSQILLSKVRSDFIGLDTVYTLANQQKTKRVYLDSTASTLMMGAAHDVLESFLDHYANSHSLLHFSAKVSTREYQWAHDRVLSFLGADPNIYACFFAGSGATAGLNRLARVFRDYRPERDVVFVSLMEHHSNDLPHRKHAGKVLHIPLDSHTDNQPGCLNMDVLEEKLIQYKDRINYVAVTGVSNVTGIINPVNDIAELVHKYGAHILVDGAQMAAHIPVQLSGHDNSARDIDAFVFSGHKTYVPGSPGVVVCRKDILSAIEPEEVGGGMVEDVYVERYIIKDYFPDREEAGTPNIPGAIALATALEVMDRIGMDALFEEEDKLILSVLNQMKEIPDVVIYGETDCSICPRAGSISFNIKELHHGLVAAILNDFFNIAVRNECFCAHPYVKEMIMDDMLEAVETIPEEEIDVTYKLLAGMVRASFGMYSTEEDASALITALNLIVSDKEKYASQYQVDSSGNYIHNSFKMEEADAFTVPKFVDKYMQR